VQVGRLAAAGLYRPLDKVQRVVEVTCKLRGHYVGTQGLVRMLHALGELEDKVAAVDLLREVDEVLDVGDHALSGVVVI